MNKIVEIDTTPAGTWREWLGSVTAILVRIIGFFLFNVILFYIIDSNQWNTIIYCIYIIAAIIYGEYSLYRYMKAFPSTRLQRMAYFCLFFLLIFLSQDTTDKLKCHVTHYKSLAVADLDTTSVFVSTDNPITIASFGPDTIMIDSALMDDPHKRFKNHDKSHSAPRSEFGIISAAAHVVEDNMSIMGIMKGISIRKITNTRNLFLVQECKSDPINPNEDDSAAVSTKMGEFYGRFQNQMRTLHHRRARLFRHLSLSDRRHSIYDSLVSARFGVDIEQVKPVYYSIASQKDIAKSKEVDPVYKESVTFLLALIFGYMLLIKVMGFYRPKRNLLNLN